MFRMFKGYKLNFPEKQHRATQLPFFSKKAYFIQRPSRAYLGYRVTLSNYGLLPQETSLAESERACQEELLDFAGMMTMPTH
jgi:hypothetical protein